MDLVNLSGIARNVMYIQRCNCVPVQHRNALIQLVGCRADLTQSTAIYILCRIYI